MHTLLVLGGYGFFGQRIGAALADDPSIRLLLGGRSAEKARAAAVALGLSADRGVEIDARSTGFASRLADLGVDTLIHTAGPFQGQDYFVARAAIEAGCSYVDLADGRNFVSGIDTLDQAARTRGVAIISGASSVPALSSAVVDRYLPRFERLEEIRFGISSGARAPGLATVRAVFSYGGKRFARWENGTWVPAHGWLELQRRRFPAPLGNRWLSSCDIPDLELFPKRYPTARTVTFHAGFASGLGHLVVWSFANLVRAGILHSMAPLAMPLNQLSRWIEPFVSHRGGMFVELSGIGRNGAPLRLCWNLLAGQNHGPHIPCGAAIALARKFAHGATPPPGAMPCMGLLSVEEFLAPLRDLDIQEIET